MLQSSTELVDLFGLGPEEELLERFACALLQTYHCSHNDFTPEQQVPQMQPQMVCWTCAAWDGCAAYVLAYMDSCP